LIRFGSQFTGASHRLGTSSDLLIRRILIQPGFLFCTPESRPFYSFFTASLLESYNNIRVAASMNYRRVLSRMESYHQKIVELADQIDLESDPERQRALIAALRELLEQQRLRMSTRSPKP
jgi:hypothetical protein